jgi:hypothetical protein
MEQGIGVAVVRAFPEGYEIACTALQLKERIRLRLPEKE